MLSNLILGRDTGAVSQVKVGSWLAQIAGLLAIWAKPETLEAIAAPEPESTGAKVIASLALMGFGQVLNGFRDVLSKAKSR